MEAGAQALRSACASEAASNLRRRGSRILAALCSCLLLAACFVPRVQDPVDRPQEARLEQSRVALSDGAALPLVTWGATDARPRAVIVAVHGLNDYSAGFADTAEYLAAQGFVTYAFDQRGFGAAAEPGIWAGEDVLADDVWQVTELIRQRHTGVPVYALGESMGAAVLLHALARHPGEWIDAAVIMAPAVWNRHEMPWYARAALPVLAHTWRSLKFSGRSLDRSPTNDPAVLRRLSEDPLVIHKTRVDVLWGIANLMDAVTTEPLRVDVPMLILYGGRDEIVPPNAVCAWLASLEPSERRQFAFYPEGWHLLTRDLQAATVKADLAAWLASPGVTLAAQTDAHDPSSPVCEADRSARLEARETSPAARAAVRAVPVF
jgi:alpha-beta hydrolase superfamily lysophospholipase